MKIHLLLMGALYLASVANTLPLPQETDVSASGGGGSTARTETPTKKRETPRAETKTDTKPKAEKKESKQEATPKTDTKPKAEKKESKQEATPKTDTKPKAEKKESKQNAAPKTDTKPKAEKKEENDSVAAGASQERSDQSNQQESVPPIEHLRAGTTDFRFSEENGRKVWRDSQGNELIEENNSVVAGNSQERSNQSDQQESVPSIEHLRAGTTDFRFSEENGRKVWRDSQGNELIEENNRVVAPRSNGQGGNSAQANQASSSSGQAQGDHGGNHGSSEPNSTPSQSQTPSLEDLRSGETDFSFSEENGQKIWRDSQGNELIEENNSIVVPGDGQNRETITSGGGENEHQGHSPGNHDVSIRPPKEGDLPFFTPDASGHQHEEHGIPLNEFDQADIGQTLGLPDAATLQQRLDEVGAFNPGQNDEQKKAGTFLALNTAAKLKTLPAETLETEENAMRVYGQLKVQGLAGDGAAIRETLVENGGDPGDLTDQQLVDLWGANEHQNLHAVLFGNEAIRDAAHITSLSDNNGQNPGETQLGGFNDKGEFPQHGFFDRAKEVPEILGI